MKGEKIQSVLRDVNRGAMFLAHNGIIFTHFENGIFVDDKGRGIMISLLEDWVTDEQHKSVREKNVIVGYKKFVVGVITKPFEEKNVDKYPFSNEIRI